MATGSASSPLPSVLPPVGASVASLGSASARLHGMPSPSPPHTRPPRHHIVPAGKTYTMEGPASSRGISYRTVHRLFEEIAARRPAYQYTVQVGVIEVRVGLSGWSTLPISSALTLQVGGGGEG